MTADAPEFVHRFEPGSADAPTLVLLHGTGGDETALLPLGRALDAEAALLSLRGQVSERGAARFFRRHAEGVLDIDDLVARTHRLADFVAAACRRYERDPNTAVAVGFSNGANIAASTLLLRAETFRAALLLAPMVVFDQPERVDLSSVGVFIGAGRQDSIAPPEHSERLADQFIDRGASVQLHWHPGGHEVAPATVAAAQSWLAKLRATLGTNTLP